MRGQEKRSRPCRGCSKGPSNRGLGLAAAPASRQPGQRRCVAGKGVKPAARRAERRFFASAAPLPSPSVRTRQVKGYREPLGLGRAGNHGRSRQGAGRVRPRPADIFP